MDGYFLSKTLTEIALAGEQAKVPLLAGSNTEEQGARAVLAGGEPTPETLAKRDQEVLRRQGRAGAEGVCRHHHG